MHTMKMSDLPRPPRRIFCSVLPTEDDNPLIVAANKELLGTNNSITLEQERLNLNVYLASFYQF